MRNHKTSTPVVRIYAQIQRTPGLSTVELAERLELARTVVARWLTELVLDGRVRKEVRRVVRCDAPPFRTVRYFPRVPHQPAVSLRVEKWTPQPWVHPYRRSA